MRRDIKVKPYNPEWPNIYAAEAAKITTALGTNCLAIHHVGSTAIPGLIAKPRIDIIVVVNERPATIENLKPLGYEYRGEFNVPFHYGFRKRDEFEFNLHIYDKDHPDIESLLTFRDYLRKHSDACEQYAKIKQELLQSESSFEKNKSIFTGYALGKNAFINEVLKKAGFNRLKFMRCTHYLEWETAKKLRQKYFFDKNATTDPYTWTFDHPDHVHFVLYQGTEIIGYAHIQLCTDAKAMLRIIVVAEGQRNLGYGSQFINLIEKWLAEQHYTSLHTESSPEALEFYKKHGYINMPFPDHDENTSNQQDIAVGKQL